MAISFAALHWLEASVLGDFTLLYVSITLALVITRSLASEPLVILAGETEFSERLDMRGSAGLSLIVGLLLAALVGLWAGFFGPSDGSVLFFVAFTLPLVLVQDAVRYWFISKREYWKCSVIDLVTLVGSCVVLGIGMMGQVSRDQLLLLIAWSIGALSGLVVGVVWKRVVPTLGAGGRWYRNQRTTGLYLAGSTASQQASGRLSLFFVRVLAGAEALGELSASRTALSPLNTLITACSAFVLPEAVNLRRTSLDKLNRFIFLFSVSIGLVVAVVVGGIWLIPDEVGELIAGANWSAAHSLLVPTGCWLLGFAISQGPRAGIRALGGSREMLGLSLCSGVVMLVFAAGGAALLGSGGAAWGFGLASLFALVPWFVAYGRMRARADL